MSNITLLILKSSYGLDGGYFRPFCGSMALDFQHVLSGSLLFYLVLWIIDFPDDVVD